MNRRANASQNLIVGFGAVSLVPVVVIAGHSALTGNAIVQLGISGGPSALAMMGAKDAAIFTLAIENGASATGSFMANVARLAEALQKVVPGGKVDLIGNLNGSPIFGSTITRMGIVERNGVTYIVKAVRGQAGKILGKLEK